MNTYWARSSVLSTLLIVASGTALANGTETLGPPNIAIAPGTNLFIEGTGTITQPGTINVSIPPGATIKQVLLYWQGYMIANVAGDNTVSVSNDGGATSTPVTGTLIGGQTFFFNNAHASTFRADITNLQLVSAGSTDLIVSNMAFTRANNGAGALVIYDTGTTNASIAIRDGSDLAFINNTGNLKTTVPQTFTFQSSNKDRTAQLNMFFASVSGTASAGFRRSVIKLTTNGANGGTTLLNNLLDSNDGNQRTPSRSQ